MSSVGSGSPDKFVMHDHDGTTYNFTANTPNQWMSVNIGAGRSLAPTHYVLRHGTNSGGARLIHWRFEGSNDGATWTVLKTHTHGTSPFPDHGYSVAAWPVDPPAAAAGAAGAAGPPGFQHFRIIQTGKNSSDYDYLMCAGIELYGLFTEEGSTSLIN